MINLIPLIARIRALLDEDTPQSVTYAALEARLAIEKVCYDRLRQRHDYISHADLKRWQPAHVINIIIAEVDSHLRSDLRLEVANPEPTADGKIEYFEIGTEIGFDPSRLSKMWNALAKLALHVRMPEKREDEIDDYGEKSEIISKVEEVLTELERLSKGSMVFSGIGYEVQFNCQCGQINKRRHALLKDGQLISCFNPSCANSYKVRKNIDNSVSFTLDVVEVPCGGCGQTIFSARRPLLNLKRDDQAIVRCEQCGHPNEVIWILVRKNSTEPDASH